MQVKKIRNPALLKDLRKISLTSEFSLVFECFIKDWILKDIEPKIDHSQYGNRKGTSTEHWMVNLMDKLLKLLDNNSSCSAVIAAMVDWASAFERQDPTLAIEKFIKMGVRPALTQYWSVICLTDRFNNTYSSTYSLPGGGPQGTLIGLIEYLVQSKDNCDMVDNDMKFKFVDDQSVLELVMLGGLISEYNFKQHVALIWFSPGLKKK